MTILSYKNQNIEQRDRDGYVNLTQMCRANGKELKHWSENKKTLDYLQALSLEVGIPTAKLCVRVSEGFPAKTITWGHPLVAIALGQWISPAFHVWCNTHIKTLIETGKTEIKQPTHSPQPVTDHTISEYRLLMELLSEDGDDRMMHLVKNHLAYRLQAEQSKVLPGGVEITQLEGVVDVAIRLSKYLCGIVIKDTYRVIAHPLPVCG